MTASTQDTTEAKPQDFLVFLAGMDKGRPVTELGAKLQELVAAIENTGKGGSLTLKITVKPAGKSDALTVTNEITVRAPKLARPESIFFPDENHNLVRSHPDQLNLI